MVISLNGKSKRKTHHQPTEWTLQRYMFNHFATRWINRWTDVVMIETFGLKANCVKHSLGSRVCKTWMVIWMMFGPRIVIYDVSLFSSPCRQEAGFTRTCADVCWTCFHWCLLTNINMNSLFTCSQQNEPISASPGDPSITCGPKVLKHVENCSTEAAKK